MKTKLLFLLSMAVATCFADNSIINYKYLADPAAVVVGDSIFYILADTDYDSGNNGYTMKAGYLLSSKDMKNWTDHGEVFRVPRDVSWANGVWAPAIAWYKGKMLIYFPNGASGIGVITSSDPAGPYTDPVGGPLINPGRGECDGIAWCFDPGVFIDDDGQGYLTWGGGNNAARPYGNNFSMVRLNEDKVSWSGSIIKMTGMKNSFEASYITKHNNKYYLSYSSQDLHISYAMSNSPTGPWTYKGSVMDNPNINGKNINANNNNHHGFASIKGKWYAAYHERRIAIARNDPAPAYHRSVSIDLLEYNADDTFKSLKFTNEGPDQIANFNPFDSIPATTSSLQNNINACSYKPNSGPVYNLLTPKPSGSNGSWIRLSQVEFGSGGAYKFAVNAASLNGNNEVEIRTGSPTGTLAGKCSLPSTGSWSSFQTTECPVSGLTGVVPSLYLKFTGSDSSAGLKWWRFFAGKPIPQGPFDSTKIIQIPGTLEAENFDVGGEGVAYHDNDYSNAGDVYRKSEGVDITGDETSGYQIGWTEEGEWIEYTVNINQAGSYEWEARVSSGTEGSGFHVLLDSTLNITGSVEVPKGEDWDTYTTVTGKTPSLEVGKHILRIEVDGKYFNLDYIKFTNGSTKILTEPHFAMQNRTYQILDIRGAQITRVHCSYTQLQDRVRSTVKRPGIYFVRDTQRQLPTLRIDIQ